MHARTLIDLPTRFHLWCAEHELRHTPGPVSEARCRSLDQLRDYRRARQFPHNTGNHPTPVFADDDGRLCAVGHLMHKAGDDDVVRRIAATANYARIAELDPATVDAFASRSGLRRNELARIQPGYLEFDPVDVTLAWILVALAPFALMTIVLNAIRFSAARLRSFAARAGVLIGSGMVLVYLAAIVYWLIDRPAPKPKTAEPCLLCYSEGYYADDLFTLAVGLLGLACLVAGLLALRGARFGRQARYDAYNSGTDLL